MKKKNLTIYKIKVLDIKYRSELKLWAFKHIHYSVKANCEDDAIEKAKNMYMKGENGDRVEELPILLKIFSLECTQLA